MARRRGKQVRDDSGRVVTVHGKAGNGEDSVYPDGDRWRATYRDAAGKRRTVSGATRAKAIAKRAAKVAGLRTLDRDPTVAEFGPWWLTNIASGRVRDTTLETYTTQVGRITKRLGGVRMSQVDRVRVAELYQALAADYATTTVQGTATALSMLCEEAIEQGLLPRNPCRGVPIPQGRVTPDRIALTPAQVRRLVDELDPAGRWSAAVACCYLEGMRVSEALGIATEDLDLDAGTVQIRRALVQPKSAPRRLADTKTERAKGVHFLSTTTTELLRARVTMMREERLAAGEYWTPQIHAGAAIHLVHTLADGGLPRRQAVYKAIRAACDAAGLDHTGIGCHTGRRSLVTAMSEAGVAVDDIADHVGHAQITTTRGYVAAHHDRSRAIADVAHGLLDPAAGEGSFAPSAGPTSTSTARSCTSMRGSTQHRAHHE